MRVRYLLLMLICLWWAGTGKAFSQAQYQIRHNAPTLIENQTTESFTFSAPGLDEGQIQEAYLFYRLSGEVGFQQQRAHFSNGEFTATLQIDEENPTTLEYYLRATLDNGSRISYPQNSPSSQPVRVEIVEKRTSRDEERDTLVRPIDYTILSPEPGTQLTGEDAVIATTFFYDPSKVPEGSFQVMLDDQIVTDSAKVNDYFVSYVPDNIEQGQHTARILYQTADDTAEVVRWSFTIVEVEEYAATTIRREEDNFYSGQAQLSVQNQKIAQNTNDILKGRVQVRGKQGIVRYRAEGLLTTQQSPRLQPQNRYSAELLFDDWGELRGGDYYESLSRLTLAGRRVRGINAEAHLLDENINASFIYGRMRRDIPNVYRNVTGRYDTVTVLSDGGAVVDSSYTLPFDDQGRGTYKRDVIGGRLSFGDQTPVQWGVNAIQVRDDTTTLSRITNYNDLLNQNPELANSLSSADRNYLQNNPDALQVTGSNQNPKDNFVASTDLLLNLDRGRARFNAEVGASLLNNNIREGVLDQERASELGLDLSKDIEDMLTQLSWIIIVNENMSTLPFQFKENTSGKSEMEPFVPMSIFGGQSRLSLNYFNNNLNVRYRWMGPDFQSIANSTIRRDIAGYEISDRIQLFQNKVFVTVGYEDLHDNVIGNNEATTETSTWRTNVSWYPVKRTLPRVSAGIKLRSRDNGIERMNPFLSAENLYASVRNINRISQDSIRVMPQPVNLSTTHFNLSISQQVTVMDVINDVTLNLFTLNTDDKVFEYGDTESLALSLNVQNRYSNLPLNTRFGFNINTTESLGGLSVFDIFGVHIGGTAYLMDGQLTLRGNLAFTSNKRRATEISINKNGTPDDFKDDYYEPQPGQIQRQNTNSYVINMSGEYQIAANHAVRVHANLNNVVSSSGTRSTPNDHILEARYIFNF